jgi:hypothetical protein
MKMNLKKLTLRSGLGILALTLMVSSAFALLIGSQTFSAQTITNNTNLATACSSLFASPANNNGSSGGHEIFTYTFTCGSAVTSVDALTSAAQGVFTVASAASFTPTFAIALTGTATVTSQQLDVVYGSLQGGSQWCAPPTSGANAGDVFALTTGTPSSLSATGGLTCHNGGSANPTNVIWYDYSVVVSTYGSVNVPAFTLTWTG